MQLGFSWLCVFASGLCGVCFTAPSVPREDLSMHPDQTSSDLALATVSQHICHYSEQEMKAYMSSVFDYIGKKPFELFRHFQSLLELTNW